MTNHMERIIIPLTKKQVREFEKRVKEFRGRTTQAPGWGCVVNVMLDRKNLDGVLFTPKAMRVFMKAYRKAKKGVK